MIHLSQQIPQRDVRNALPLVRTPPRGILRLMATGHELTGTYIHWYAGRSQPCRGDQCKACLEGTPARWMAYLPGRIADGPRHAIVEIPRLAAQIIQDWQQENGSLRGAILEFTRLSKRPNGRVSVSVARPDTERDDLPPPPDMPRCLATLWQVKLADFESGPRTNAGAELRVDADSAADEADPTHIKQIVQNLPGGNGK
jgi:hypothetical protein